jgi:Holliday junction resolvase RusA-like endonuclease
MRLLLSPLPLKISTNKGYAGKHWTIRSKEAELYHLEVVNQCRKQKLKKAEGKVYLNFIFSFKGRTLDHLNCSHMAKMIEDGLVRAGILIDDNIKYVESVTIKSQKGEKDEAVVEIIEI